MHAGKSQPVGDPPQKNPCREIYLAYLSDGGERHDGGATSLRAGAQN